MCSFSALCKNHPSARCTILCPGAAIFSAFCADFTRILRGFYALGAEIFSTQRAFSLAFRVKKAAKTLFRAKKLGKKAGKSGLKCCCVGKPAHVRPLQGRTRVRMATLQRHCPSTAGDAVFAVGAICGAANLPAASGARGCRKASNLHMPRPRSAGSTLR